MEGLATERDSYLFDFLLCLQSCAVPGSSDGSSGDASSEDYGAGFGSVGHGVLEFLGLHLFDIGEGRRSLAKKWSLEIPQLGLAYS